MLSVTNKTISHIDIWLILHVSQFIFQATALTSLYTGYARPHLKFSCKVLFIKKFGHDYIYLDLPLNVLPYSLISFLFAVVDSLIDCFELLQTINFHKTIRSRLGDMFARHQRGKLYKLNSMQWDIFSFSSNLSSF